MVTLTEETKHGEECYSKQDDPCRGRLEGYRYRYGKKRETGHQEP